jgi:signal transduction histidine kinase
MPIKVSPLAVRATVTLAAVIAALALRMSLASTLGSSFPYVTFVPVVVLCAWYGGLWMGLGATLLSASAASYYFIDPPYNFQVAANEDSLRCTLFIACGVLISFACEVSRIRISKAESASHEAIHLLECMEDGCISVDERGLISYVNGAAEEMIGRERGDLLGNPFAEAIPGMRSLASKQRIQMEVAGAASNRLLQMDVRPAPNGGFTVRLREAAEWRHAERALGESERKKAEDALRRSNQELQQFAYSASHDLKEPLRMIRSYMQLMKSRYAGRLDKEADEYIDFAVNSSRRMQELVDSLLEYASAGDMRDMPVQVVDANESVRHALASLQSSIKESEAEITWDTLPQLIVNEFHAEQLFQNLIGNAIKYRGERRPKIDVSASNQTGMYVFAVRDNGIGIESRHFEKIFGVFERIHGRTYPGSGIGLATCQRIVARYGGRIWVESQPGIGSTFYFTLPAATSVARQSAGAGA